MWQVNLLLKFKTTIIGQKMQFISQVFILNSYLEILNHSFFMILL
jgi:hypothetical protein